MRRLLLSAAEKACDTIMNLRRYPKPEGGTPAPPVIAHRGAWDTCPENSMAAFVRARDLGAWGIELDVRFTEDGVPVVNHDPDLARLHAARGNISDLKYAELRQLAPAVPRLSEVLALKGLHFMIEVKPEMDDRQVKALAETLSHLDPVEDFHLLALRSGVIRKHTRLPLPAWILVGELDLREHVESALAQGIGGVAGHYLGMTDAIVARLHDNQLKCGVGFTPSRNLYHREWARQIDWVFTNRPAIAR